MKQLVLALVAVLAFAFIACNKEPVGPAGAVKSESVTTPPPIRDMSDAEWKAFQAKLQFDGTVNAIKSAFGEQKPKDENAAWNDMLCRSYMSFIDRRHALTHSWDAHWNAAGIERETALQMHAEDTKEFSIELAKLILTPMSRRKQLEEEWEKTHTCDDMLSPADTIELVKVYTSLWDVDSVNSDNRPVPTGGLRKILLQTYRDNGEDMKFAGLYWFTREELGLPPAPLTCEEGAPPPCIRRTPLP